MIDILKKKYVWLLLILIPVAAAVVCTLFCLLQPAIMTPLLYANKNTAPVYDVHQTQAYPRTQFLMIDSPLSGDKLISPLTITGRARLWYFEGSFPIELKDDNGKTLATGQATAQGDWMTNKFVPFKAELVFKKPATTRGTLTFKKDNPSGLPANDDQVTVPVQFKLSDPSWQ